MIRAILNCDKCFGIGRNNDLLFHLPKDMKFFRETTLGHVVAMGENTLLSFPGGKPLPKRTNLVLSADPTHEYKGVINVHSFADFLKKIKEFEEAGEDVFIIGGASIYRQMLPYCDEIYLTKVDADGHATAFFENLDNPELGYSLIAASDPTMDGDYSITFTTYSNTRKQPLGD